MIIYLVLGIIFLILATLGVTLVILMFSDNTISCKTSSFFLAVLTTVILTGISIFGFIQYHNTLIDKAMLNMEIGNYIRTEFYENGSCYKVKYRIGNIDFD